MSGRLTLAVHLDFYESEPPISEVGKVYASCSASSTLSVFSTTCVHCLIRYFPSPCPFARQSPSNTRLPNDKHEHGCLPSPSAPSNSHSSSWRPRWRRALWGVPKEKTRWSYVGSREGHVFWSDKCTSIPVISSGYFFLFIWIFYVLDIFLFFFIPILCGVYIWEGVSEDMLREERSRAAPEWGGAVQVFLFWCSAAIEGSSEGRITF